MSAMFMAYLRVSLTGAVLAVCVILLRHMLPRRAGLTWREIAGAFLVLHLLIPVWLSSPISAYTVAPPRAIQVMESIAAPLPAPITIVEEGNLIPPQEYAEPKNTARPIDWRQLAAIVWCAGIAVSLGIRFARFIGARRIASRARPIRDFRTLSLVQNAALHIGVAPPRLMKAPLGPAVRGAIRPQIFLPEKTLHLSDDALYMVLLHECAHIRRRDVLRLHLLALVDALHWWNPVLRVATNAMRGDIELGCDDVVLRKLEDAGECLAYGRALIAAATKPGIAPAAGGSPMKERISMIKTFKKPRTWMAIAAAVACCVLAVVLLTVPAKTEVEPEPTPAVDPLLSGPLQVDNVNAVDAGTPSAIVSPIDLEGIDASLLLEQEDAFARIKRGAAYLFEDVRSGATFSMRLTSAPYHSSGRFVSDSDQHTLLDCLGGDWTEEKRPVRVSIDGSWYAASIDCAPCGGDLEDINLCVYFLNSTKDAETQEIDPEHQMAVYEAAKRNAEWLASSNSTVLMTISYDAHGKLITEIQNIPGEDGKTAATDGSVPNPDTPPSKGEAIEWSKIVWTTDTSIAVVDYRTRKTFSVTRIGGALHADFEPTTAEDTAILKECFDGEWSWDRRPVLVYINDQWVAASISGYPHGIEIIDNNGVAGSFCMHFAGSRNHGNEAIDDAHQQAIGEAAQ